MDQQRMVTFEQYKAKVGQYPRAFLDYYIIINALKNERNLNNDDENIIQFKGQAVGTIGRKQFYKLIHKDSKCFCINMWQKKYNKTMEKDNWRAIFRFNKETKLQALQWKIAHNIAPNNNQLHKMGIKESPLCEECKEMDNTEHMYFKCKIANMLWREVQTQIRSHIENKFTVSEESIIFGYLGNKNTKIQQLHDINHTLAIGKLCIHKYRFGSIKRNILEIWETESRLRTNWI